MNKLYYGDNLDILRKFVRDETVDLCYIDPPFNSKRNYNQIYNNIGQEDPAQAQAFVDTWTWDDHANECFDEILTNKNGVQTQQSIALINGLEKVLGKGALFAYQFMKKSIFNLLLKQYFCVVLFFASVMFSFATSSVLAQNSIADLITRIKPSVVKITVFNEQKEPLKSGSGFFISQTKVITNKHVIAEGKYIEIKMFDGTLIYANKIQTIPDIDIAVLEFNSESKNIKPLLIAVNPPREGDKIIVYGSPLGLEGSVSDGIVSATRKIDKAIYMQITAPISHGSSGSPVIDMSGRVVGIATLNIEGGQNLNFAIPAQQVASFWINQISDEPVGENNSIKQETKKSSQTDLTGNWKSLAGNTSYQIIDDGKKLSITTKYENGLVDNDYDAKWAGDVIIGYHNSEYDFFRYYFIIKILDSEKIGFWNIGTLRPKDSEEKILRELTKKAEKKPKEIWKRTR
ncbi:MAG: trypsin-like peptidase domain-containing protein [Acidobacteriota bacterium]|nr:trypsin-like peptidase domain-containing protein [Acidobacteriota bacterium]